MLHFTMAWICLYNEGGGAKYEDVNDTNQRFIATNYRN
jgi:hypothetical protein